MIQKVLLPSLGGVMLTVSSLLKSSVDQLANAKSCIQGVSANCSIGMLQEAKGFPFSFLKEQSTMLADGSKSATLRSFDFLSASANLLFWIIVSVVLFKVLAWAFEVLSKLAFVLLIVAVVLILASLLGL